MVLEKGIEQLRKYIQSEVESCIKKDKELTERRKKNGHNFLDNMEQAVLNSKNMNVRVLKDILQEIDTDDVQLEINFYAQHAGDLPRLRPESFKNEGIRLEGKGGIFQASAEAMQAEFVVFWVSSLIGIVGGSITISQFIFEKLQKLKNTKVRIGKEEADHSSSQEEIQKMIQTELQRLKDEIDELKKKMNSK